MTARADRAALEWAIALGGRAVALTVGPPEAGGVLAWALGRGADRAIRIWDDDLGALDLSATARVVSAAVRRVAPDVVVAGERGLAGATGALPALVAAHLGWPCVAGAIRLGREEHDLVVERRLGGGRREELAVPWPAVVTVAADSAEPRYVSVRARRDAAGRGHETWSLADLGLTVDAVNAAVRLQSIAWTGRGRVPAARRRRPPGRPGRPPTGSVSSSEAGAPRAGPHRRRQRPRPAWSRASPARSPTASSPSSSSRASSERERS